MINLVIQWFGVWVGSMESLALRVDAEMGIEPGTEQM